METSIKNINNKAYIEVSKSTLRLFEALKACDELASRLCADLTECNPNSVIDPEANDQAIIADVEAHIDPLRDMINDYIGKAVENNLSQSNYTII